MDVTKGVLWCFEMWFGNHPEPLSLFIVRYNICSCLFFFCFWRSSLCYGVRLATSPQYIYYLLFLSPTQHRKLTLDGWYQVTERMQLNLLEGIKPSSLISLFYSSLLAIHIFNQDNIITIITMIIWQGALHDWPTPTPGNSRPPLLSNFVWPRPSLETIKTEMRSFAKLILPTAMTCVNIVIRFENSSYVKSDTLSLYLQPQTFWKGALQ